MGEKNVLGDKGGVSVSGGDGSDCICMSTCKGATFFVSSRNPSKLILHLCKDDTNISSVAITPLDLAASIVYISRAIPRHTF